MSYDIYRNESGGQHAECGGGLELPADDAEGGPSSLHGSPGAKGPRFGAVREVYDHTGQPQ